MLKDILDLFKVRILVMQLVTFAMGYFMAGPMYGEMHTLWWGLFGTMLASAGAATLNHVIEIDVDKKMKRTQDRPLPSGRMSPIVVAILGCFLTAWSGLILFLFVNGLTAFISLLTVFLYVAVYTPLKRFSMLNTLVGAIPGALPPLGGWAAAVGFLSLESWYLFALLFVWQLPHFYAIAWLCREDYKAAGLKMISNIDSTGKKLAFQALIQTICLIAISLFPLFIGTRGLVFSLGMLLSGLYLLYQTMLFYKDPCDQTARKVLKGSILYLLLILMVMFIRF